MPVDGGTLRGPLSRLRTLILVAALAGTLARSDERWVADLSGPDPFVRARAAIALSEQVPQRGLNARNPREGLGPR